MINTVLSQRLEGAIAESHRRFSENHGGQIFELSTGGAYYSGANSPLSQVMGWGFAEGAAQEIESMEAFYRELGIPSCDIELSPFVGESLVTALSDRDYRAVELSQISVYEVKHWFQGPIEQSEPVRLHFLDDSDDYTAWGEAVAAGFEAPAMAEVFAGYAQSPGIRACGIWEQGSLVAGGTVSLSDGVADLGVTSTLPSARGRGYQRLLIAARLNLAVRDGAELAVVTTAPGSVSDRNVQRCGFRPAYTRVHYQKLLT